MQLLVGCGEWKKESLEIDGRDWDHYKLVGYFNSADADAIAKIKLPTKDVQRTFLIGLWRRAGCLSF
jgi:hypothetical protein